MNSHEYAEERRKQAEFLLSKPAFKMPGSVTKLFICFYGKEQFVEAVKALGTGKKEYNHNDLDFIPDGTEIVLSISRSQVCKLVSPAVYDCEPLLSREEEDALGKV